MSKPRRLDATWSTASLGKHRGHPMTRTDLVAALDRGPAVPLHSASLGWDVHGEAPSWAQYAAFWSLGEVPDLNGEFEPLLGVEWTGRTRASKVRQWTAWLNAYPTARRLVPERRTLVSTVLLPAALRWIADVDGGDASIRDEDQWWVGFLIDGGPHWFSTIERTVRPFPPARDG